MNVMDSAGIGSMCAGGRTVSAGQPGPLPSPADVRLGWQSLGSHPRSWWRTHGTAWSLPLSESANVFYGTCNAGLPCECRANLFISEIEALYDRPEFPEAT